MYPSASPGAKRIANFAVGLKDYGWKSIIASARKNCVFPRDNDLTGILWKHNIDEYKIPCRSIQNHINLLNIKYPYLNKRHLFLPLNALIKGFTTFFFKQSYMAWAKQIRKAVVNIESRTKVNAIWVTIPPFECISAVSAIFDIVDCSIVLDIRDPWTLPIKRRKTEWPIKFFDMASTIENNALSKVKCCVFNSEKAKEMHADYYNTLPSDFWEFIPNGFEHGLNTINPFNFDRFTMIHAGIISQARTGHLFLNALKGLVRRFNIRSDQFQFINMGSTTRQFKKEVSTEGLADYVKLIDHVPYRQCLEMQKGADWLILLVGEKHAANIPSKIYEYFSLNRPILAIGPRRSEALEIVGNTRTGIVTSYDNISNALAIAYGENYKHQPIAHEMHKYRLKVALKKMFDVLEKV